MRRDRLTRSSIRVTDAVTSAGNNLEDSSPSTCHFTAGGDLVGMPAGLGPLADNGGPGPTHALLANSPAIDHIPVAACTDQQAMPRPVATDERGVPRGLDGHCDIGAYEFAPAEVALTASASPTTVSFGHESTLTVRVANSGPAPATAVALNVALPAGLALVSSGAGQGSCARSAAGVSCSLGLIAVGGSAQATVTLRGTKPGMRTATATVGATEPDPAPAGELRSITITVRAPAAKIRIRTPRNGATYTQGARVKARYSCHDPAGKAQLRSCKGTIAKGKLIETERLGRHSFKVTARIKGGHKTTKIVHYTVVAS